MSLVSRSQDALRLDPSNPTFHLRLASALELAASEQEAIEALDVMARTFPSTTWEIVARHRAGMLALAIGERRRAKESLGRALEGLQKRRERGSKERVDIPTMEELVDIEREVKEGLEELETNAGKEKLSPLELPQVRYLLLIERHRNGTKPSITIVAQSSTKHKWTESSSSVLPFNWSLLPSSSNLPTRRISHTFSAIQFRASTANICTRFVTLGDCPSFLLYSIFTAKASPFPNASRRER